MQTTDEVVDAPEVLFTLIFMPSISTLAGGDDMLRGTKRKECNAADGEGDGRIELGSEDVEEAGGGAEGCDTDMVKVGEGNEEEGGA